MANPAVVKVSPLTGDLDVAESAQYGFGGGKWIQRRIKSSFVFY